MSGEKFTWDWLKGKMASAMLARGHDWVPVEVAENAPNHFTLKRPVNVPKSEPLWCFDAIAAATARVGKDEILIVIAEMISEHPEADRLRQEFAAVFDEPQPTIQEAHMVYKRERGQDREDVAATIKLGIRLSRTPEGQRAAAERTNTLRPKGKPFA